MKDNNYTMVKDQGLIHKQQIKKVAKFKSDMTECLLFDIIIKVNICFMR